MPRRRVDAADVLLEDWATWRYLFYGCEVSTGDCSLVHFNDPRSTASVGSQPLWQGPTTRRSLITLNNELLLQLGLLPVARLVAFYGTTGPIDKKAKAMDITVKHLQELTRRARGIALAQLSRTESGGFHDRQPRRQPESKRPVPTHRPEPETDS